MQYNLREANDVINEVYDLIETLELYKHVRARAPSMLKCFIHNGIYE